MARLAKFLKEQNIHLHNLEAKLISYPQELEAKPDAIASDSDEAKQKKKKKLKT